MLLVIIARILLVLVGFQDVGPLIWTGKGAGGANSTAQPTEKDAPKIAPELRQHLEALKTQTEVKRDFAKQLATLDSMRMFANWSFAYAGKALLLSEIAELRAEWLEKLGRHAEAVFAAQYPLVMPEEQGRPPYDTLAWSPSNGSLAALQAEIDALPRMVALRKRFSPGLQYAKGGDAIEEVVRSTLESGNPGTLRDFGTRCVPALQKALLARPDADMRVGANDPLAVLLSIDRKAGEALIVSTVGKRGPVWTLRAINALAYSNVSNAAWIESTDPYTPPRFDDALALQALDAIAAQPMTALQYFQLLEPLVGHDVTTPAIQAFLVGQVETTDALVITVLRSMLDGVRVGPNKRALYEAFLDSPDPDLRARCANALAFYPAGPATLRAVAHSDPRVRSSALQALVRHLRQPYDYRSNSVVAGMPARSYEVPRTPEIQAALLKLARDPESSVRAALVRALQEAREAPPADVLGLLLADADPQVRQSIAYDWSFDPELQARVLEKLASDSDPQVLRSVGFTLNIRAYISGSKVPLAESKLYLPALAQWLTNPATSLASDSNVGPKRPIQSALASLEGARAMSDVCLHGPRRELLAPALLEAIPWARNRQQGDVIVDTFDAPTIATLFTILCEIWPENRIDQAQQNLFEFATRGELACGPFLEVARDESRARTTRARALVIAAPKAGAALQEVLIGLLAGATPAQLDSGDESSRKIHDLLRTTLRVWPELSQARPELATAAKIPDAFALMAIGLDLKGAPLDAASTRACLQRWARLDESRYWEAKDVLLCLDPRVDPGVFELWRSLYRLPRLSLTVVGTMGKYPLDESVPLLTECVRAEWMDGSGTGEGEQLRTQAIGILTMRLDDLGADALLKAIASARNDDARTKCFAGLEQIRKYQDEKQSWQKRKGGEAAREQAIADLLPMLTDKEANIRSAAARSLATLQAIEHLPKLVALLKDKDASVREAAQKALDALNSAQAKKP